MAIALEIIYLVFGIAFVSFIVMIALFRLSNGIISRKLAEIIERISHLEKVARHHSRLLAIENMKLKHRVKELEKHVEKAERVEETEQLIEKALNKRKK